VMLLALARPADEMRSLLERGIAFANQLGFTDADFPERRAHRRPGALADADRRDIGRLHEHDLELPACDTAVAGGDQARRDPAGGAAADDDNPVRDLVHRFLIAGEIVLPSMSTGGKRSGPAPLNL